ncbi:S8 family serine peptidase [Streptosporangium sp. NPDC006007]|uniref:S8 family peptidase n=1 Tax=Streptosporangium sp. NPDC006007 TaxID=3154575 RepID=UPI0033B49EB0
MRLRALAALVAAPAAALALVLGTAHAMPAPAIPVLAGVPAAALRSAAVADEDGARMIVEVTAPAEAARVAREARALPGAEVVLQPPDASFIVVEGAGESLAALAEDPRVVSVRRDRTYSPASLASGLRLIGADRARAGGADGTGTTIAIVDTGIDRDHPALEGRIVAERCFSVATEGVKSLCPNGKGEDTSADAETAACHRGAENLCEHGTHVAGIAHAVAPGADIVAVQVFSRRDDCAESGASCLSAYESSLLLALDHLAELKDATPGLVAVNLSLGGGLHDGACDGDPEVQAMKERIDTLRARGVVTVAAAGNEGMAGAGVPGCLSAAVTVGATGDDDRVPGWSNRGSVLDLFAPGVEIDSSVPGGGTRVHSGTSMSTPHVTGALAVLAQGPATAGDPDLLVGRLTAAGRPIVHDGVTTPRLDLYGALTGQPPSSPVTQSPDPEAPRNPEDPDPDGPGDGSPDDPSPDPSSGPPPSSPSPAPTPVPLPTVTVTVTVTATPAPAAPRAAVCARGKARKTLSAARWAAETGRPAPKPRGTSGARERGRLPEATIRCYLGLVGKASRVFSELTSVSTPAAARRVLSPAGKTGKARLESELLAAWLNWAHGGVNLTAGVGGAATVKDVLTSAEDRRLRNVFPETSISLLRKQVNARRTA